MGESDILDDSKVTRLNSLIIDAFGRLERLSNKNVVLFLFLFTFTISAPMLIGFEMNDDPSREGNKDIDIFETVHRQYLMVICFIVIRKWLPFRLPSSIICLHRY